MHVGLYLHYLQEIQIYKNIYGFMQFSALYILRINSKNVLYIYNFFVSKIEREAM